MKSHVYCIQNNNQEILHFSRPWSSPYFLKQDGEKLEQITLGYAEDIIFLFRG